MELKSLTPDILVAGQIGAGDVAALAERGVRAIINNRPDGEGAGQPMLVDIERSANEHGIAFRSIPFTSGRQTMADVEAFRAALDELPRPLLIYCRTGMRSSSIWAMAQAGREPIDDLVRAAAGAGYDLSPMRPVLQALAAR
ncbi:MAG: TIGR01244 family sulfur transferase [Burkholderiaceae bacterium]